MGFKRRKGSTESIEARTEFLNVDLELCGPAQLAPLVLALSPVFVLHKTDKAPFVANLEAEPGVGMDLRATLSALLDRIEALGASATRLWDECSQRRFDIGIQAGLDPAHEEYALPAQLLRRLANVGAEVVVTIYGARVPASGLARNDQRPRLGGATR